MRAPVPAPCGTGAPLLAPPRPGGQADPSIQVPAGAPPRGRLRFAPHGGDSAGVTLGRCRFSSGPRVIDDFSGANLPSALRILAKVKNLDGPDDIAGAIPATLSDASQPFVEIGLLGLLFPLVALSAKEAVKSARAGYARVYPAQVRKCLDEQSRMIDALSRGGTPGSGVSDADLDALRSLHDQGAARFEERQLKRQQGFLALLKHNFANKRQHKPGNGKLSKAFNRKAEAILAHRGERHAPWPGQELAYRAQRLSKAEGERQLTKRARTPALLTGAGMPGMAAGMAVSSGAAASEAGAAASAAAGHIAGQAAACTAAQAFETTASGILLGAQLAQGASGVLSGRVHHAQRRQLLKDAQAVRALAPQLPGPAARVFEQDVRSRSADSVRSQICDAGLAAGQAIMAGSSIATLATAGAAAPVTMALAVPGAALTVAASVGAAFNEARQARYAGDGADEPVKARLRQEDFGDRLRATSIDALLDGVSSDYLKHQALAVQTRMWRDILDVLQAEDLHSTEPRVSASQRLERLRARNRARGGSATLLGDGVKQLHGLRERSYPLSWFEGSALQLHERLHLQLQRHPVAALIEALPEFRREVLFKTARDLTRSADQAVQALFRGADGRLRARLQDDAAFFELVNGNAEAYAAYLRRHNEALARHLEPANLFGRADSGDALADLAHAKRRHDASGPLVPAAG